MNLHGLKVLDFHSHFPIQRERQSYNRLQRYIDRYGERRARKLIENSSNYRDAWRKMWQFDDPESGVVNSDKEQAARWVADMNAKSLSRVNFVMGGGNDNLANIVSWYPDRFTGFAHHSIFSENAAEELERGIKELGLKGFKLIASGQEKPIDSKEAYPVWEMAENLEVPVLIHFGVLGGGGGPAYDLRNMNPLTLWKVAADHPTLEFVIPHFGACYWRELLQLCWQCPNVLIDTSGSNQWMRWMPYEINIKTLIKKAIETVGPDRIIFGTDSSYFPRGFSVEYLREQMRACYDLGLEEESIQKIFYNNAARLLKL